MSDHRLLDDFLDPWLEATLSDAARGGDPAPTEEGGVDLAARLHRVAACARIVDRIWRPVVNEVQTDISPDAPGMPPVAWQDTRPTRVGRFEIRRELGRGGGGVVFLAFDPTLERDVALKVPQPGILLSMTLRERFLREARAAASLDHHNIISVYETGTAGPIYYIASAYCPGPTLSRWLQQRRGPVPIAWAVDLVTALADGVQHAHERGILHRDLKPGNVLLEPVGGAAIDLRAEGEPQQFEARITDFGLALLVETDTGRGPADEGDGETHDSGIPSDTPLTRTGAILGTASYMAPEQAAGRPAEITAATDVHALGVMLYEMLCGQRPFERGNYLETLAAVQRDDAESLRQTRNDVPRDLDAICLKCLQKNAARRYSSAGELAADLRRFATGRMVLARPISRLERLQRSIRRRPARAALIATASIALLVLVAGLAAHNHLLSGVNRQLNEALAETRQAHQLAEQREAEVHRLWYSADLQLAHQAWTENDPRHHRMLLERHQPGPDGTDQRGWEWQYLWQLGAVERQELGRHEQPLYFTCLSPDGQHIAFAGESGTVTVLDRRNASTMANVDTGQGEVNGLAFSPDGRQLATAGDDGTVRLLDVTSWQQEQEIRVANKLAFRVCYSPDGRLLATCSFAPEIHLWDAATGARVAELARHTRSVEAIAFSPDGQQLASAASDASVILWDLANRNARHVLNGHHNRLSDLAFSPMGDRLATCGLDGQVCVWDTDTGLRTGVAGHLDQVQSLAFVADGQQLAVGDRGGSIAIWDLTARGESLTLENKWQAHDGRVYSLVGVPEKNQLLSAGSDGALLAWQPPHRLRERTLGSHPWSQQAELNGIALIPHTRHLATAHLDGVRLWRLDDGEPLDMLVAGGNGWSEVCGTPDGRLLVGGSEQGEIVVWDLRAGTVIGQWRPGGDSSLVLGLAISRDGGRLAVVRQFGAQDHLRLFHLPSGQELPGPPPSRCDAVAFSPVDDLMAFEANHDLVLWDLKTNRRRWANSSVHESTVTAIRFRDDGRQLVTASHDRRIKLWDTATGRLVRVLSGNRSAVKSIAFAPDGRSLISAERSGAIALWYLDTGQRLFDVALASDHISRMEWTPSGNQLVLRSTFRKLTVLDLTRGNPFGAEVAEH